MKKFFNKKIIFIISIIFLVIFWNRVFKKPTLEKEIEQLEKATQESIDKEIEKTLGKDYKISDLKFYNNNTWAIAVIQPITFETDPALIIYKKEGKSWRIFLGPGTSFEDTDPQLLNQLPQEVKKEIGVE